MSWRSFTPYREIFVRGFRSLLSQALSSTILVDSTASLAMRLMARGQALARMRCPRRASFMRRCVATAEVGTANGTGKGLQQFSHGYT